MVKKDSEALSIVNCPVNANELVNFCNEQNAHIKQITEKALSENRWTYAEPIVFDPSDDTFLAYWFEKTRHPIIKPLVGHEYLEEHFRRFRHSQVVLNGGLEGSVELSFVGDLMSTHGLKYSRDLLYSDTADLIFGADISFANLESTFAYGEIKPLSFSAEESPKINLNEEQYCALTSHRGKKYTLVQLANNHILDCGENGIKETVKRLESDNIAYVGVNRSEEDSKKTLITEMDGIRIGWVAHTFSVNGRQFPEGKPWIVNMTGFHTCSEPNLSSILSQIEYCKSQSCDVIIASMHWGLEFELYPHPEQMEWAQAMADAGADIIIGHHPHMVQYYEIIHPSDMPQKDVPVVYSLGNLTPVFSFPETALSLIARISVAKKNDKYSVSKLQLVPVGIFVENNKNLIIKPVRELAKMEHRNDMCEYINRIVALTDMILGEDWR